MSGMIDGVNKFYIVYHDNGSMHMEGYKTIEDMAMGALTTHSWKGDWFARMEAFKTRIDELVAREKAEVPEDDEVTPADTEAKG